jgi:hypothetical protein
LAVERLSHGLEAIDDEQLRPVLPYEPLERLDNRCGSIAEERGAEVPINDAVSDQLRPEEREGLRESQLLHHRLGESTQVDDRFAALRVRPNRLLTENSLAGSWQASDEDCGALWYATAERVVQRRYARGYARQCGRVFSVRQVTHRP